MTRLTYFSTSIIRRIIRKSEMMGDITVQQMTDLIAGIPLPPIQVPGFTPPQVSNKPVAIGDCCKDNACDPQIKILVTWVHEAPCGNFVKKTSGYAVGNKLTDMPSGQSYRFDGEVFGCPCPGTWSVTVTPPAGATSYGHSSSGSRVDLLSVSPVVYTITFTYTVCDKTVTKTFTLGVK